MSKNERTKGSRVGSLADFFKKGKKKKKKARSHLSLFHKKFVLLSYIGEPYIVQHEYLFEQFCILSMPKVKIEIKKKNKDKKRGERVE